MPFNVKKRGKLTYYSEGDRPVLSALVTEQLPDGDLKISFAGLTGGYSGWRSCNARFSAKRARAAKSPTNTPTP